MRGDPPGRWAQPRDVSRIIVRDLDSHLRERRREDEAQEHRTGGGRRGRLARPRRASWRSPPWRRHPIPRPTARPSARSRRPAPAARSTSRRPLVDPLNPRARPRPAPSSARPSTCSGTTGTIRDLDVITNITHPINREVQITPEQGLQEHPARGRAHQGPRRRQRLQRHGVGRLGRQDGVGGQHGPQHRHGRTALALARGLAGRLRRRRPQRHLDARRSTDFAAADTGTLNGLSLASRPRAPARRPRRPPSGPGGSIAEAPGTGPSSSGTVVVSGAPTYLTDVNLATSIEHDFDPSELTVRLVSPQGTSVHHQQRPRHRLVPLPLHDLWNDSASALITNATWTGSRPAPQMVPEGSLGAFIGQNPNGTWKLIRRGPEPAERDQPRRRHARQRSLDLTGTDSTSPRRRR